MFSQSHLFSPNYPRFAALGGVSLELGCSGGDRKCRSKRSESPPWVCEKCAKSHAPNMGCGEAEARGEVIMDPPNQEYYYVENTEQIDDVLGAPHYHSTYQEQMGCDKCKEGQRKKRKKAQEAQAQAYGTLYNMRGGFPVMNVSHTHRIQMGQSTQDYTCPINPAQSYDPSLNCMRDARGNAVCSDGQFYPPGCPHTPPDQYFTPGISPDQVQGGIIQAQIPPPRSPGSAPSAPSGSSAPVPYGSPAAPAAGTGTIVAAGAGALGIGTLLFFLFK